MKKLPLHGVRVADFSWVAGATACTSMLARMGAEVVRIESMERLDPLRGQAPFLNDIPGVNRGFSYNCVNVGKKACTLNLHHPRAIVLAKELVRISDLVVENFSAGVIERLGLGYEVLKDVRPGLIMVSVSGLGRTGPLKGARAFGQAIHAYSGLTALTGYPDGEPRPMGYTWIDPLSGMMAVLAILAALHHRDRTGEGQYVDISMCETFLPQHSEFIMDYVMNGRIHKPKGNRDDFMAPHGVYRCIGEDKWVAIAVATDEEWRAFCQVLGRSEWIEDDRFGDGYSRWQNQDELDRLIEEWTRSHSAYEVMEMLQKAGVAAAPSFNAEELIHDPHLRQREFFTTVDYEGQELNITALPWKISGVEMPVPRRSPFLGEHNEYVFCQLLHMSKEEVAGLVKEKVIC